MKRLSAFIAVAILSVSLVTRAQDGNIASDQPPFDYLTQVFDTAATVSLADVANFGAALSRTEMVTVQTTAINTMNDQFGYYLVNVVDGSGQTLTRNWLMQATTDKAAKVLRKDGSVLVTDILGANLSCYDLTKLNQGLATLDSPDGAVVIDNLAYFTKAGCPAPKFDEVISTIRVSGNFLITKTEMLKGGQPTVVGYYYSWNPNNP